MWFMRIRIPELMNREGSDIKTAYALSHASGLSMTNAHHLVRMEGRVARVDMRTLEALCAAFDVTPDQLLETDAQGAANSPKRKGRKRAA